MQMWPEWRMDLAQPTTLCLYMTIVLTGNMGWFPTKTHELPYLEYWSLSMCLWKGLWEQDIWCKSHQNLWNTHQMLEIIPSRMTPISTRGRQQHLPRISSILFVAVLAAREDVIAKNKTFLFEVLLVLIHSCCVYELMSFNQ